MDDALLAVARERRDDAGGTLLRLGRRPRAPKTSFIDSTKL
jgi:hypothetical protein